MLALSDKQLEIVSHVARALPVEKRGAYLERIAAHLQIRCGRFTDRDVADAAQAALAGLMQHSAA